MKRIGIAETGGPDVLQCEDSPEPHPGDRDVTVKVAACGTCGHDSADRAGLTRIDFPNVLGHEVSGEVVEVGARVSGFEVGDRVASKQFSTCGRCLACRSGAELDCPHKRFLYGGYAEYVAIPADSLLHVPEEVPLAEAAVVACAVGTCLQALTNIAHLQPGETVVVTGAGGGLGLHGVQVAHALGARVVAVTSTKDKIATLEGLGADRVVLAEGAYARDILDATPGGGVEVVLDNVGHPAVFDQCFRALAKRGRYVLTGQLYREKISLYPAFVFAKEAVITGSGSTLMSTFMRSMAMVADGRVRPVVQRYALPDAAAAHADMDANHVIGRAVLTP
jgi:acryloyl-coenzyme A reductase